MRIPAAHATAIVLAVGDVIVRLILQSIVVCVLTAICHPKRLGIILFLLLIPPVVQ
jgi:hypothetical protein